MWNTFQVLPVEADGAGSKKEVVVYWPAYFPNGSHISTHTFDSVPDLLVLDTPPTFWTSVDKVAEDTQPPTVDDKAAALATLIEQVKAAGGDTTVLVAIAADAGIVLPVPDPKAVQTKEADELAQAEQASPAA